MQISSVRLQGILPRVQKPARYVGGELNAIVKDWETCDVRMALSYPDIYDIGMSNLGLGLLYALVNKQEHMLCERVYAPWPDMEKLMREAGLPLYSLETRHSLDAFDVWGFGLQYELTFTNVLNMLDMAGIPMRTTERTLAHPLIISGGSCNYNPGPMADFMDAMIIGEGEEVLIELLNVVRQWKETPGDSREELLLRLAGVPGVYVPSFYEHVFDGQELVAVRPTQSNVPARVTKRIVARMVASPTKPIVANIQIVHDRATIEIQRGCSRGCRFCQAGIIYRPIRERPAEQTLAEVDEILKNTGYTEISFVSLSSSDHSAIKDIVQDTLSAYSENGVGVSLPSLRIDSFSVDLAQRIQSVRKTGFTFAPEAGSQRLRDVINKGITEEEIMDTARQVFEAGWNRLKLYFMIGLPTETDEDVEEIVRLVKLIRQQGQQTRARRITLSVSVNTFVPKPHTPFQWLPLLDRETVERRQNILKSGLRSRDIKLSWSDWETTWLEAVISRGDRRLSDVVYRAWKLGARFDSWREWFDFGIWEQALQESGIDTNLLAHTERALDGSLPWDDIDVGVSQAFLQREWQQALKAELSPDCRRICHGCGINLTYADLQNEVASSEWGCP